MAGSFSNEVLQSYNDYVATALIEEEIEQLMLLSAIRTGDPQEIGYALLNMGDIPIC